MEKFTLRDALAIPFWYLAQKLDYIAISIGGAWTSDMYMKTHK